MMTTDKPLLSDVLDGYIRGSYLVAANGAILATITSDRDSRAYGPLSRRYVRAVAYGGEATYATSGQTDSDRLELKDGQAYAGSCPNDSDHVILRKVKA